MKFLREDSAKSSIHSKETHFKHTLKNPRNRLYIRKLTIKTLTQGSYSFPFQYFSLWNEVKF